MTSAVDMTATRAQDPPALTPPSRVVLLRLLSEVDGELEEALVLLRACGIHDCENMPIGVIDRLLLAAHRAVLGRDPACARGACGLGAVIQLSFSWPRIGSQPSKSSW